LADVLESVRTSRSSTFPVVDGNGVLVGVLSFSTLRALVLQENPDAELRAKDVCDKSAVTLTPDDGLGVAFRRMEAEGLEEVPVVDPCEPRPVGHVVAGRSDRRVQPYRRHARCSSDSRVAARWSDPTRPNGSKSFRSRVPPQWIGKTLREIDTRRYGVVVLAVQAREADADAGYQVPDGDRQFRAGDGVVLGRNARRLGTCSQRLERASAELRAASAITAGSRSSRPRTMPRTAAPPLAASTLQFRGGEKPCVRERKVRERTTPS
jgi:CBS domain-containing protein